MGTKLTRRLHALTSLRFVAASSIIALHCAGHFGLPVDMTCGARFPLYLGVGFFFVLSGFILTYVYPQIESRAEFGRFLWARFARIWPCHVFALGLMFLALMVNGWGASFVLRDGRALPSLASLALVHSWIPVQRYYYSINLPSWSVATEFGFYLAFPLLLWRLDRRWPAKLIVCLLPAVGLIAYAESTAMPYARPRGMTTAGLLYMHPLARLFEFCVGMVTASFWRRMSPRLRFGRGLGTMLELTAIAALATNIYFWRGISTWICSMTGGGQNTTILWLSNSITCLGFAAVIFVAALERGWISKALTWRGFVFLGEISYAAYLLHTVFIQIIYPHEASLARYPFWAVITGYVAIVLASATVSWHFVEAPSRKFLMGLLPKPGAVPAPHYTLGSRAPPLGFSEGDRRESLVPTGMEGRGVRHN